MLDHCVVLDVVCNMSLSERVKIVPYRIKPYEYKSWKLYKVRIPNFYLRRLENEYLSSNMTINWIRTAIDSTLRYQQFNKQ